jgi:YfiR/HmsC-like
MNSLGHISLSRTNSRRVRMLISVAVWIGLVAIAIVPSSAVTEPTEYQIKSAFLYNFAKYVRWPNQDAPNSSDSFGICILGTDPFGPYLDSILTDKSMNSMKLEVKRISRVQDATGCQILFISSSEENRLVPDLAALKGKSVLTVGEMPHFAEQGGMIQFIVRESMVRFEINLGAADRAGLAISSQLLKLATMVRGNRSGGD